MPDISDVYLTIRPTSYGLQDKGVDNIDTDTRGLESREAGLIVGLGETHGGIHVNVFFAIGLAEERPTDT